MCGFDPRRGLWICDRNGTVRQLEEAAKLKPWCVWVRIPPVLLDFAFGRVVGHRTACKAVAFAGNVGSIPTRGTRRMARWSNGLRRQVVNLKTRVQLPYEPPVDVRYVRDTARSSSGIGHQVLNLITGVRFPHGSLG